MSSSVEHDAAGRVERLVPGRREVVGELLDARLVADGRERVRRAGGRLGRVLAARAVHLVELLGPRVVGLHLVVVDGPRRRDAVVVAQLAEVLLAQAVQRGAVELRGAADEVVHLRLEGLAVAVVPRVRARRSGCRRRRRARASSAARAGASRRARAAGCACPDGARCRDERPAAGAASDHDHVVVAHQLSSSSRSATMIRAGGLDQREVRERLREVAQVAAGVGVELLGVQPERRGDAQQALHQVARALLLADDRQRRHEPERADEERALLARQAVVGLAGAVAQHEAVLGQLVGDGQHARAQPLVVARAGSRRARRAGSRRRARRSRSAGAARRGRRRRARGCRP